MTKSDTADFLKNEFLKINPCKHNIHKSSMITVIRKIKSFITDFVSTKSMLAKINPQFSRVEYTSYSLRLKKILTS